MRTLWYQCWNNLSCCTPIIYSDLFTHWWQRLTCMVPTCSSGAINHFGSIAPNTHTHTYALAQTHVRTRAHTPIEQPLGAICVSVSCPRTLRHANHQPSNYRMTHLSSWATTAPQPKQALIMFCGVYSISNIQTQLPHIIITNKYIHAKRNTCQCQARCGNDQSTTQIHTTATHGQSTMAAYTHPQ